MVCKEVWNDQIIFIFIIFYHSWFEHLITKYWDWVNPIHLLSLLILMLLILEICQNLEGQKINNNPNFWRKFWLISEIINKQKKKNWVELSHSAIANWERNRGKQKNNNAISTFLPRLYFLCLVGLNSL